MRDHDRWLNYGNPEDDPRCYECEAFLDTGVCPVCGWVAAEPDWEQIAGERIR
jgi:uncharacterized protein (DUF2225 family)